MKLFSILLAALLACALETASAQGASRLSDPNSNRKKTDFRDAAERLRKARDEIDMEKAKDTAAGVLEKLPPKVSGAAKSALESAEQRQQALDAAKSAAGDLLPQAQEMLKREAAAQQTRSQAPETRPAAPLGPIPEPLRPLPDASPMATKTSVIIESDASTFDLNTGIFIYTGHVRARHPQFYIECEELEVHMSKEGLAGAKTAASPPAPAGATDRDDRIKMAYARGPMVTIEKVSDTGELQQGKCKSAVYRGSTGGITMSDYPQVQRGNVLHIATDPGTQMTFDPEGRLHTSGGRQRTVVLQPDPAAGTAPPATASPQRNR